MTRQPAKITDALPAYEAVLWDMDGTLVLSEPLIKKSLQAYQEKIGFPITDDLYTRATGISYRHAYDVISKELAMTLSFDDWQKQSVACYIDLAETIERRAETAQIVEQLYKQGIKQAVVSNSPRDIVLANVKGFLREFREPDNVFTTIISADDVKAPKPDPEGYLLAAQRLNVRPENCLVIEDSQTGLKAGVAARCFTVYWPPEMSKPPEVQPGLTVENLLDVFPA